MGFEATLHQSCRRGHCGAENLNISQHLMGFEAQNSPEQVVEI
jgi:hypothetical protein